jgi:membrane-associated phospholipid phosphatase
LSPRHRRSSRASSLKPLVRAAASAAVVSGVAVPLARKRLKIHPALTIASLVAAPAALAVLYPRTRGRDVVLYMQQMWGFTIAHELPVDDEAVAARRLRVTYPIKIDTLIGGGQLPNARLQRLLAAPADAEPTALDKTLSIVHWAWFAEPHLALVWILLRDEDGFPRAARQMAAAFDLGCLLYAAVPTAPPWWASEHRYTRQPVRRIMAEVGERFWGRAWPSLYASLGGNPWAAMPSLHFATSVLAAVLLSEQSALAGTVGWSYAATLGFALVYLGEHYVTDLLAGLVLVAAVREGEPLVDPLARAASALTQGLERVANG